MTPPDAIPAKTSDDLEWPRLQQAIAARCRGPLASRLRLSLAETFEQTERGLSETREAMQLLAEGQPLPLDGLRDLSQPMKRLERHGVLEAAALADIMSVLGCARALRRFLGARRAAAAHLFRACATDPSLDELEAELGEAIEGDGTLRDNASPDLKALRDEVTNLRARIVGRLEQLIHKHEKILQDRFHTVREGRYVLPVRTDAHERFAGIVHATSSSGATLFVEPRSLVELGNRLKMAEGELQREQQRILAALSARVSERIHDLHACIAALDHADLRAAGARFGLELGCHIPTVVREARMALGRMRHPLLVLDGIDVVPHDIELEAGRALVISGPNAGGKTVALKAMGLAALMVRAGLPLPCAEGAHAGFFGTILSDIGDDQSTITNLSTFSAHVRNIGSILARADHETLTLLDELAGGTDPQEGAALACAVVEGLCERGATVAITTHYEALKALAIRDDRLRNASVGIDMTDMSPTFELTLDVPGASSAFSVARRYGFPDAIVDRAEHVLPEQSKHFEELTRELANQVHALKRERSVVAETRATLDQTQRRLDQRLAEIKARGKKQLDRETTKLLEEVRQTRTRLQEVRSKLQRAEAPDLPALAKTVDEVANRVALGGELEPPGAASPPQPPSGPGCLKPGELQVGDRAYLPRLRSEAIVTEVDAKGRLRVAVGAMKLWVELDELQPAASEQDVPSESKGEAKAPQAKPPAAKTEAPNQDNTLDIRGLRVDDALGMVESFVDRMYGASRSMGFILHGHGTGALRDAVRKHLADALPHVTRTAPAPHEQGGNGLTAFYFD